MKLIEEFLRTWFPLILIIGQFILGYMGLMFGKRFATKKELNIVDEKVKKNEKDISDVDNRVSLIKNDIKHMPTSEDIKNLRNEVCKLSADISGLESTNISLGNSVKLFNQYLINQGKEK